MPSEQLGATVGDDTACGRKLLAFVISNGITAPPEDTRILEEQLLSMTDNRSVGLYEVDACMELCELYDLGSESSFIVEGSKIGRNMYGLVLGFEVFSSMM